MLIVIKFKESYDMIFVCVYFVIICVIVILIFNKNNFDFKIYKNIIIIIIYFKVLLKSFVRFLNLNIKRIYLIYVI